MSNNFLLVRSKCPHCREMMKVIKKINFKLPVEKQINIFDGYIWEKYGIVTNPILLKFRDLLKRKEGYPLCYLEGNIVEPSDPKILYNYLIKFFEEDLQ